MSNSSLKVAPALNDIEQGFEQAERRYQIITNISSKREFLPGDILISYSGNMRLMVSKEHFGKDSLRFLSFLNNQDIKIENADLSQINHKKILMIVRMRNLNPICRSIDYLLKDRLNYELKYNLKALLRINNQGRQLNKTLQVVPVRDNKIKTFALISTNSRIDAFTSKKYNNWKKYVEFYFNPNIDPSVDYIQSVGFYPNISKNERKLILTSCVLANLFQNAKNLQYSARQLGII